MGRYAPPASVEPLTEWVLQPPVTRHWLHPNSSPSSKRLVGFADEDVKIVFKDGKFKSFQ